MNKKYIKPQLSIDYSYNDILLVSSNLEMHPSRLSPYIELDKDEEYDCFQYSEENKDNTGLHGDFN